MNMAETESRSTEVFLLQRLYNYYRNPIYLDKDRTTGLFGWLFILLFVVAYDFYAIRTSKIETLTRFFWRSTETKIFKSILIIGVWVILSFHLLIEKPLRRFFQRRNIYEKNI
jgi:hypothetical protein